MLSMNYLFENTLIYEQCFYDVEQIAYNAVMSENYELVESLCDYLDDRELITEIDPMTAYLAASTATLPLQTAAVKSYAGSKKAANYAAQNKYLTRGPGINNDISVSANVKALDDYARDNPLPNVDKKTLQFRLGASGKNDPDGGFRRLAIQRSLPHQAFRDYMTPVRYAAKKIGNTFVGKAIKRGFDRAAGTETGKKVLDTIKKHRDSIGTKLIRSGTKEYKAGNERKGLGRINLGQAISSKHKRFKENQS